MMKEWEIHWEDYYKILGVSSDSDEKDIRKAWIDLNRIYHPDRLQGESARVRSNALKKLKKINRAYGVLANQDERSEYHSEWLRRKAELSRSKKVSPKPVVEPSVITFTNVKPGKRQSASFVVRNIGGPWKRVMISETSAWINVAFTQPLTAFDKLPMLVGIEAVGYEYGHVYSETIRIKLDNEVTSIRVELATEPKSQPKIQSLPHMIHENITRYSERISQKKSNRIFAFVWRIGSCIAVIVLDTLAVAAMMGFHMMWYYIAKWAFG